jgi:low temperature requirement protein LtrA
MIDSLPITTTTTTTTITKTTTTAATATATALSTSSLFHVYSTDLQQVVRPNYSVSNLHPAS